MAFCGLISARNVLLIVWVEFLLGPTPSLSISCHPSFLRQFCGLPTARTRVTTIEIDTRRKDWRFLETRQAVLLRSLRIELALDYSLNCHDDRWVWCSVRSWNPSFSDPLVWSKLTSTTACKIKMGNWLDFILDRELLILFNRLTVFDFLSWIEKYKS